MRHPNNGPMYEISSSGGPDNSLPGWEFGNALLRMCKSPNPLPQIPILPWRTNLVKCFAWGANTHQDVEAENVGVGRGLEARWRDRTGGCLACFPSKCSVCEIDLCELTLTRLNCIPLFLLRRLCHVSLFSPRNQGRAARLPR